MSLQPPTRAALNLPPANPPPPTPTARSTLKMTDDVLCVRVSPNGKLLAASLLDSTVRVFFVDSLKFFLSLYGHKLPVLSMDISSGGQPANPVHAGRAAPGVA